MTSSAGDLDSSTYLTAAPPSASATALTIGGGPGVPEDQIRPEGFSGY